MKTYSNEVKVGIMIVIFITAALVILYFMKDIRSQEGTEYVVQFSQVNGISPGDSVRYAGVNIGKVKNIEIKSAKVWDWDEKTNEFVPHTDETGKQAEKDQAFITIILTDTSAFESHNPVLTDKSNVTISSSLMNDRWIEINPKPGQPLKQGSVILGKNPVLLQDFIAKTDKAVDRLNKAVENVNNIIGNAETQKNIKLSLENFKDLTANLKDVSATTKKDFSRILSRVMTLTDNANMTILNVNDQVSQIGGNINGVATDMRGFSKTLERMAKTNEGDIRVVVKNLVDTSKSLNNTLKTVESLVTRKEFSEDILTTLRNIKNASAEVEGIACDIRSITSDGQIREDLKVAISEAKKAALGANKLINGIGGSLGIEGTDSGKCGKPVSLLSRFVALDADVEYNNKSEETTPRLNATILPYAKRSLKLGVDNIGFDNLWNLQYKLNGGTFSPRLGVIRSKLGGGLDLNLGKSAGISVDAYNTKDWQVDITGRVMVKNGYYLHGGVRDVQNRKATVFGVGKRF